MNSVLAVFHVYRRQYISHSRFHFFVSGLMSVLLQKDTSVPLTFKKRYNTCYTARNKAGHIWRQCERSLWPACRRVVRWWWTNENVFSLFLISNTPSVQLLLQTHQTSLVTEAKGRPSMGESASRTCLRSNCTQPTCPAASDLIFCSPVVTLGEFSLLQEW